VRSSSPARPLEDLLLQEEDETLEKKESLRSHDGNVPDEKIVDEVLRACLGFLNRLGGTVLVGVTDDHQPVGVSRDIKKCRDLDHLGQFLTGRIREKIGDFGIDLIATSFPTVNGAQIIRLEIDPSPSPVFALKPVSGKEGLWVRNNNSTENLSAQQVMSYVKRHWPDLD